MSLAGLHPDPYTDVIVTGIPRSGTTLVAALLDNAENTVCLLEPDEHIRLLAGSTSAQCYVEALTTDFRRTRDRITAGLSVLDRRSANGCILTNYFSQQRPLGERREPRFEMKAIDTRHLQEGFTLAMKHNVEYTSVLPELVASRQFKIICPIRNPIATILSWNTLTTPVARGAIPAAGFFWREVERELETESDLVARQVLIFDSFCRRYFEYRDRISVVAYEHLLGKPELIAGLVERPVRETLQLRDQNRSSLYDWDLAPRIYATILERARHIHHFYPDADLRNVLSRGSA